LIVYLLDFEVIVEMLALPAFEDKWYFAEEQLLIVL